MSLTAGPTWAQLILWLPLLSMALCGLCAALRVKGKAPAWITVGLLGASFVATLALYIKHVPGETMHVHIFDWINIGWGGEPEQFVANFALYVDSLTLLWMLFVTGLGTLIALYASEYMEPDVGKGYARFFAGVSVFLFAMTALVMGDNLVMLYLGWEGVGFASYWLIGYYYRKPSAVAAAKKAFIMNRIGDLGLALAIWFIWLAFGTVEYSELFELIREGAKPQAAGGWQISAIPFLLMLGAFGKSAQIPLYVWLPDAMEGPTPVSALIHAATMVTAGVYLLARMFPMLGPDFHPYALPTVAWIGAATALLSATIGMAQYDIKRIMAYSTVSQLGYMFAGIGVLTTFGAAYHVFTHAFFKAVLFLTCGAIMHGFAGQLDLRKLSGLRHMTGWKITSWTMLIGCLCLAGFPFTSGYFSKDAILAEAFTNEYAGIGWVLLITAGLTAYYTFRVWFRVCAGPVQYEMGDEHHGEEEAHDEYAAGLERTHAEPTKKAAEHARHHEEHPHEPHAPRFAINIVLIVITVGAILAAIPYFMPSGVENVSGGWVAGMIEDSSARSGLPGIYHTEAHGTILLLDPHKAMYFISAVVGLIGIAIALYFHLLQRKAADTLRARLLANPMTRWLPTAMENKWYVDELYDFFFRGPLWIIGHVLDIIDRYIVDGLLVNGTARLPRLVGRQFQPMQNGILQSYGIAMIGGAALIALLVLHMPEIIAMIDAWRGGQP